MPIEPTGEAFGDRRRALEEAFFKERDRELLEKFRSEFANLEEQKKLAHVSGIADEKVLKTLVAAGVRAETLTAMSLVPMVEVAWCDGSISPQEKAAVLNAAAAQGIKPDSASHQLLAQWLDQRPGSQVVTAWKDYIAELVQTLPPETVAAMRSSVMDRCRRVAEAAGGFLGLNTVSKSEQAKIAELSKAYG